MKFTSVTEYLHFYLIFYHMLHYKIRLVYVKLADDLIYLYHFMFFVLRKFF